jgi:hypothetical protein
MPVFRPRNRLVNFRLSEDEFEKLRAICALQGARSLSDFARAAVLRSVNGAGYSPVVEAVAAPPDPAVAELDRRVHEIESRLTEMIGLLRAIEREEPQAVESGR